MGVYIIRGGTLVYCSIKNTEIAWLHCKQCEDMNPCAASADLEADEEHEIKGLESGTFKVVLFCWWFWNQLEETTDRLQSVRNRSHDLTLF